MGLGKPIWSVDERHIEGMELGCVETTGDDPAHVLLGGRVVAMARGPVEPDQVGGWGGCAVVRYDIVRQRVTHCGLLDPRQLEGRGDHWRGGELAGLGNGSTGQEIE